MLQEFSKFAKQHGYDIVDPVFDGQIHRFDAHSRKSGWYIGFEHHANGKAYYHAIVGDWANGGEQLRWSSAPPRGSKKPNHHPVPEELNELIRKAKLDFEAEVQAKQQRAADIARKNWSYARPVVDRGHRYLESKGLRPQKEYQLRVALGEHGENLLVPMYAVGWLEIQNIQEIDEDGHKHFLEGGRVSGMSWLVGHITSEKKILQVCEGVATAITLHEATGHPTVAAFSCGNLGPVVDQILRAYPDKTVVVCADNDVDTDGNPGLSAAQKTSQKYNIGFISPSFLEEDIQRSRASNKGKCKLTDFNDLYRVYGMAEVKKQLEIGFRAIGNNKKKDSMPVVAVEAEKKRNLAALYYKMSQIIDSGELGKFFVVSPELGVKRLLYVLDDDLVVYCHDDFLVDRVLAHSLSRPEFRFTPANARDAATYWIRLQQPIDEPKIVRFKSEAGLCFHRLPFDPVMDASKQDHPLWKEFLGRCSDPIALEAFIGSIFVPESDRHQYLWLYGHGNNGKSTLIKFLHKCLGIAAFSTEPPKKKDDNFWTYRLIGKRLVTLPDCSDYAFPSSQKFKMISGGDKIAVEPKGKQAFNVDLNCKFVFASNEKPSISSQKADLRRVIFCKIDQIKGRIKTDYFDKLWAEAPSIVGACLLRYYQWCPDNGPIQTNSEEILNIIEEENSSFDYLFNKFFALDTREGVKPGEAYRFSRSEFARFCEITRLSKSDIHAFRKFMEIQYNVVFKTIRLDHSRTTCGYVGAYPRNTDRTHYEYIRDPEKTYCSHYPD